MSDVFAPSFSSKYNAFLNSDFSNSIFNNYVEISNLDYLSSTTICRHLIRNKVDLLKYDSERLLDTEGILYVPYRIHVRLLITSMDVIHSFAVPSLGIKADAIPGRLNDLHFFLTDNSAMTHYFGQCSELCGVGHAFMRAPFHLLSCCP